MPWQRNAPRVDRRIAKIRLLCAPAARQRPFQRSFAMVVVSVLIIIVAALLALVVLAQNPKGGGLAAGFTGAQQIGGV